MVRTAAASAPQARAMENRGLASISAVRTPALRQVRNSAGVSR